MDLSKINKSILISLTVIAVSFLILEVFSRIFFFISDRDIKAFKKFPGRYIQSYFSGYKLSPNWVMENKQTKETINDFKNFLFPVSLILKTYNFTKDVFEPSSFKKIRDDYNDRVGFSQVNIKDCNDPQIKKSLEILGFKVI